MIYLFRVELHGKFIGAIAARSLGLAKAKANYWWGTAGWSHIREVNKL